MNRAVLFDLPFIKSYNPGKRRFVSMSRTQAFLGYNFYPRLNSIYTNLVEAMAKKDYRYLGANLEKTLVSKLFDEMNTMDSTQYNLRLQMPKVKLSPLKPKRFEKFTKFRERVWSNGMTKIGLQCFVYFGQKFDRSSPLLDKKDFTRVGEFRYLKWNTETGLLENVGNLYNNQTFEFVVRYSSKMHLKVLGAGEIWKNEKEEDEEIISEVTFQSGNDKFDWVITDVNGISSK